MSIVAWIVLGLASGLLGNMVIPGKRSQGLILTCLIGIAGALVGGWAASTLFPRPYPARILQPVHLAHRHRRVSHSAARLPPGGRQPGRAPVTSNATRPEAQSSGRSQTPIRQATLPGTRSTRWAAMPASRSSVGTAVSAWQEAVGCVAHAYAYSRQLADLARDIVARRVQRGLGTNFPPEGRT
jgi:uncharacterized membrane protein YeaQ/YmgE (transglycosylase-associated protein family)